MNTTPLWFLFNTMASRILRQLKVILKFSTVSSMLLVALMQTAYSREWNYFGDCYSDDVILALNGKWFTPCMGRGCKPDWEYGGTYRALNRDVIEIYWKDDYGVRRSRTMTNRKLSEVKCKQ